MKQEGDCKTGYVLVCVGSSERMWLWDQWIGVDIRGCGADFLVGFLLNQKGCKIVAGATVVSGTWDEWACESTKLQVVQPLCEFLGQKQLELVSC